MPRINRFRNNRNPAGGFSLADIRDVVTTSADSLIDAISAQNPNVDADGFETELRELVSRYGRGTGAIAPGFPTMASAAPSESRYEYSLAGDLLVAASEYFKQENFGAFFQSVRDAFRAADSPKLFAAIAEMNSMTDVEDQALADDNESDILPDDNDSNFDVEAGEFGDLNDFEFESDGQDDDDPLGRDPIMADADDDGDHEFRGTESPNPMPSGDSDNSSAERRQQIAFLNRATLSGTVEDRKKVSEAVRQAAKPRR